MKKLILSVLFLGLASVSFAATDPGKVPISVNNVADINLQSTGVEKVYLSTMVQAALVTDRSGNTITSGLIYWVVRPATAAAATYLEMRDTDTANTTSRKIIPWLAPISTSNVTPTSISFQPNPVVEFNPPIPFYNGLSVNQIGTANNGCEFAIGVRWKKQ